MLRMGDYLQRRAAKVRLVCLPMSAFCQSVSLCVSLGVGVSVNICLLYCGEGESTSK